MLLDLFEYFAKFPATAGVTKGIANKGESSMEEYATVLKAIRNLPEKELVPEIENYIYGQSFDELKQRIDKLTGSFLFVDYGEVDMQSDGRRSFQCTQRIAVTVAMKLSAHADMLERVIANDRTLQMLSKVHARIMADVETDSTGWTGRVLLPARLFRSYLQNSRATAGPSCFRPQVQISWMFTGCRDRWCASVLCGSGIFV